MLNEQFELYHGENNLNVISAGFTIVLKHRATLTRGPHLPAKQSFTMDFCLCGAILNLKAFCFGAIPHIMIELIVYESVPQSRQA